jgi:electron transfer flavoprotein alpha subunit
VTRILVLAEERRGELRTVSAEAVSAGLELNRAAGAELVVAIAAADPSRYEAALAFAGVDEIVGVATGVEHFEPHVAQAALEALIDELGPAVVVCGQSADAQGFAAAVAARGKHGFASDVLRVGWEGGGVVAERGSHGGRLIAELEFPGLETTILLTRVGAFAPATASDGDAPAMRRLDPDLPAPRSEHLGFVEPIRDEVDITAEHFLLSIGRGVRDAEQAAALGDLADRLGATMTGSRPAIDAGWVPRSRGVGQSGKAVAPKVYLALGISGAAQHLAGIRGAGTVIAVNTDPGAPIFEVADYGAVADLGAVADALLSRARGSRTASAGAGPA